MSLASMCNNLASITRPTIGRDSAEGVTQTFNIAVATNIACSIQPATARTIQIYAQRNTGVDTTVYFQSNPNGQINDILTTGSNTFLVKGGDQQLYSRFQAPYWLDCEKIK